MILIKKVKLSSYHSKNPCIFTFPKSQAIAIPIIAKSNILSYIFEEVLKDNNMCLKTNLNKYKENNKINVTDIVSLNPGKNYVKRKVKKIYGVAIKEFYGDPLSSFIINKALSNLFKQVIKDKLESITISSFKTEKNEYDDVCLAENMSNAIKLFQNKLIIRIFDDNEVFINKMIEILKGSSNVSTQ